MEPPVTAKLDFGKDVIVHEGAIAGMIPGRKIPDETLSIGGGATIRTGTIIYAGSTIGAGLETGHYAVIREENEIGDGLRIWNHSTIDYGCRIGSGVRIHNQVYVAQFTEIEDDVFLAPGVKIANDLHPICTECMKGPTIKRGARIGIGAVLLPRITIGEGALVGAGAVVHKDVPPGMLVFGNPAKVIGKVSKLPCTYGDKGFAYGAQP
ncbi:MAG: acyltransferase [Planctomycetota bacterium]|jgi:acetyltransferase-like isoleucine patch superfamily enzyme